MPGAGISLVKVVMRGNIGGTQSWSSGVFCSFTLQNAGPTKEQLEAIGSAVNDAVVNYWQDVPRTIATNQTQLTGWSTYGYSATSAESMAENSYVFGGAIGGSGSGSLPTLTAMVQSLRTSSSGRSYRGRMYMPAMGAQLDAQGRFSAANCDGMATATAAYLVALGAAISSLPAGGDSVAGVASFTKGFFTPITQVLVDNIPDTQHRREDKLGATHTGSAVVTNG